jgi:hypothetical protein
MCATGTFINQWIYVPELVKYQQLTNNKIRIIENSIKEGYLFDSAFLFKDYINTLFEIKLKSLKTEPLYLTSKILMNSLYGRFGLKLELQIFDFVNKNEIEDFINGKNIKDVIELSETNKSLVISHKGVDDHLELNSSVAIAAAITSNSRMMMAPILLDNDLDILYTDTDSFKTTSKIVELDKYKYLDHKNLGGLAYEETLTESIYLTPKVYGGISLTGDSKIKIKGFKNKIEFEIFKNLLLERKPIKLNQDKWYKDWIKSTITIKETEYTLDVNDNKRIVDNKTLLTKPYHFDKYDSDKI